jgi:acyl dehydratase
MVKLILPVGIMITYLPSAQGCQDTVRLKLTINDGLRTDTLVTACKTFTWNRDGQTYSASGDHDYIFTNAQGCQDTVRLKLTINDGLRTDTLVTACKTFTWNRDGQTYTASGDHDYIFTNAQGCQDTVRLKLTINSGLRTDTLVTACKTFTWNRDGQTYSASGDHDYIFTNAQGCQDTVRLKLTINDGLRTDTLVTACKTFTWNRDGQTYAASGDHDYILTNAQGCQDTVRLKLTINSGLRTDTLVTACKTFTWNRDGQTYNATGNHDYIFTNAQGCQDTVRLKLTINSGLRTDTLVTACKTFTWNRDGQTYMPPVIMITYLQMRKVARTR